MELKTRTTKIDNKWSTKLIIGSQSFTLFPVDTYDDSEWIGKQLTNALIDWANEKVDAAVKERVQKELKFRHGLNKAFGGENDTNNS